MVHNAKLIIAFKMCVNLFQMNINVTKVRVALVKTAYKVFVKQTHLPLITVLIIVNAQLVVVIVQVLVILTVTILNALVSSRYIGSAPMHLNAKVIIVLHTSNVSWPLMDIPA
jgi:hypothetical protein